VIVSKEPPAWPQLGRWEADLGDGTVPAFSGLPVEMRDHPPEDFLLRSRHGQLGALQEVAALVGRYEGRGDLGKYRGVEHPAVLGLDLDELHVAGEPIEVVATVWDDRAGPGAAPVWVSVVDAVSDRPSGIDVALEFDAITGGHRGRVPGLPAGVYTLKALAREVPGAGDLTSEQTIEVFDGDDLT
jgi:hypothetical protein